MKLSRYYIHLSVLVLGLIFLAGRVVANEGFASSQILIEVEYDINSLIIIIAQEQAVSLRSFSLTGSGERQIRLSDYSELENYNFDRISGPVCIQFLRTGFNPIRPRICDQANTRSRIPLTIRDIFWLDNSERLIAIRLDYESNESVYCETDLNQGSCRANFQLPTPTPSATPTLTPSSTSTSIPPGADLLVMDGQLGSYFISPDLVTKLEFDNFRQSGAYTLPENVNPPAAISPPLDVPYRGVSWYEANAYCVWHSGYDRLPTVAEWQTALQLFPEQFVSPVELVEWTDTKTTDESGKDTYFVAGITTPNTPYPPDIIYRNNFGFRCVKLNENAS